MTTTGVATSSSLVVIGDRVAPTSYLQALVTILREENAAFPEDKQIQYVICQDCSTLAVSLKKHRDRISLVLVGPGLSGKQDMIARLIGQEIKSVIVLDPGQQLGDTPETSRYLLRNLVEIGVTVVTAAEANEDFWRPIVKDHVVTALAVDVDIRSMTPEQRAEHLDRRLESVTMFPSLPETQHKVSALDDLDHPRKWAEAIDPDVPVRTVILNLLNSVHYSFRSRITTIEQAVSLASARTIREVVLACTVQRLFRKVEEVRIDQFWRHSVATAFFAKMLSLPVAREEQSPQDRAEVARLGLDDAATETLCELALWRKVELPADQDPFTAGLLHDIGKVTIALCFEDALELIDPIVSQGVAEAEAEGRIWAESACKVERDLMSDIDHQIVGGRIARRWAFSPAMQDVITQHHLVRQASPPLTRLIALANVGANTLHSYPYGEEQHPFSRLLRKIDAAVKGQPDRDSAEVFEETFASHVEPGLAEVLEQYGVPENLWKAVEAPAFFRLAGALRPHVKRLTSTFLRMTSQIG
jgi:putative nucleotidyltransferase with HDIG domain